MKKQFFTFLMMIALVIVAGSAMAQQNNTPYRGGTYSYSLGGIVVNTTGNAQISLLDAPTGWTIKNVNGAGVDEVYTPGDNIEVLSGGTRTLSFNITYSNTATTGKLRVTVIDGALAGCSNFIEFLITPQALPTMTYALTTSAGADFCQSKNVAPLADNKAATLADGGDPVVATAIDNSFTFTVTPVISNVTTEYSYTYKISMPDATTTGLTDYTITCSKANSGTFNFNSTTGVVTASGTTGADYTADTFTIEFKTTTGEAPVTIPALISDGSLTVTSGGQSYTATTTGGGQLDRQTIVKSMPSIGSFTIE